MLTLLFALVYVQTGFQLGKKAEKTWKKGDSTSLASFLLFPVSHARGKVGDADMPMMGGINGGETFYRTLMTLGWPIFMVWNALVISVLGPDKIIRRLNGEARNDRYKALEASILKEEEKVDRVIRRLEAPKRQRKPRAAKQPKALPAVTGPHPDHVAKPAAASPPPSPDMPAVVEIPPPADFSPPPVQVRVTVDVTAPGPAIEEAADGEPISAPEPKLNAMGDKVVH